MIMIDLKREAFLHSFISFGGVLHLLLSYNTAHIPAKERSKLDDEGILFPTNSS